MLRRLWLLGLVLAVILLAVGCGTEGAVSGAVGADALDDMVYITVSIPPQQYLVERVGGDRVEVNVMVAPGADPHTYEPKPEQLRALSRAAAYLTIGVEFEEAWMNRISAANTEMQVVDMTEGIERMPATDTHGGEQGEHLDPHVWLSPRLVRVQAQNVFETLAELDPAHRAAYQANLDALLADIDALDAVIRETLANAPSRKFMVFHPSWGYFARDYGLQMISIEVGGQEPSAAELAALISEARQGDIKVVFAQPELSTRTAETIASELGGQVLLISPLEKDWLENMRQVAAAFASALDESVE